MSGILSHNQVAELCPKFILLYKLLQEIGLENESKIRYELPAIGDTNINDNHQL